MDTQINKLMNNRANQIRILTQGTNAQGQIILLWTQYVCKDPVCEKRQMEREEDDQQQSGQTHLHQEEGTIRGSEGQIKDKLLQRKNYLYCENDGI